MPIRTCTVSFTDSEGLRHSIDVQAETVYEAAVLAIRGFQNHQCGPGPGARLDVEAREGSVTHSVTVGRIRNWLESSAKSPRDMVLKERLKTILASTNLQ